MVKINQRQMNAQDCFNCGGRHMVTTTMTFCILQIYKEKKEICNNGSMCF